MSDTNKSPNRYESLIEAIFFNRYRPGLKEFEFSREELETVATQLGVKLPKNLGDIVYSFRYRTQFPARILKTAPKGQEWTLHPAGRGKYRFQLGTTLDLAPNEAYEKIKIPKATPGIIEKYALNDEQALLAIIRYNRLVDIFTRITCYSLQNHLRTAVPNMGQIETDEVYLGIDKDGKRYILPVQAKGGRDRLSPIQILQDIAMCAARFPDLICRPVGAQILKDKSIVLFELGVKEGTIRIIQEKHYQLVDPATLKVQALESCAEAVE